VAHDLIGHVHEPFVVGTTNGDSVLDMKYKQKSSAQLAKDYRRSHHLVTLATIGMLAILIAGMPARGLAQSATVLMHRVERALRANDNLNGAMSYSPAPGVIVLYGRVFDTQDRELAETTAGSVRGVTQVVNTLRTDTGEWIAEEERINDTLLLNGFQGVSARVIGSQVYLSGTVTGEAEKQRASRVVASVSNLQQNNFIWVKPAPIF
jgi:osmotically-inducible protein OsmY